MYCNCCGSYKHWSEMSEIHGRCKACHYKFYTPKEKTKEDIK